MMRARVLVLLLFACRQPNYVSGYLRCASSAPRCPDGFHCAADDRCWRNGDNPDLAIIGDPRMDLAEASADLASANDLAGADLRAPACVGGDGTPCADGLCHGGFCDTMSCYINNGWFANGAPAANNPCMGCNVNLSRISFTAYPNGTSCDNAGKCYGGACCTGCWTGVSCVTGVDTLACGKKGDMCQDCRDLAGGFFGLCTSDSSCAGNAPSHWWRPVSCQAGGCFIGLGSICCANGCNTGGCSP